MSSRVGIIGIVVKNNETAAVEIQKILTESSQIIMGRMGIPDRKNGIKIISVAVEGSSEEINALAGRLGRLDSVSVKSAITTVEV